MSMLLNVSVASLEIFWLEARKQDGGETTKFVISCSPNLSACMVKSCCIIKCTNQNKSEK